MNKKNNVRKLNTKLVYLLIIVMVSILQIGCSNFTINQNINNKQVTFDDKKYSFFVKKQSIKEYLQVKYKQKSCAIFCVIPNRNKTLTALKVSLHYSKKYFTHNPDEIKIMPRRFVILVSGDHVIRSWEFPELTSIQWVDNQRLLIISPHQRLIVNGKGKTVERKTYKEEQLRLEPPGTIY